MDILRSISHNSIGASPHRVVQAAIYHHTKVLCFIDDHMACFPHRIGFLDPFIDICHRRKVVHIKRCIWYFDRNSLLLLCTEKILIKSSHRTIPFSVAKVSAVFFVQYFPLFFCERDHFSRDHIFIAGIQHFIQHQDLAFHRKERIVTQILPDHRRTHQTHTRFFHHDRLLWNLLIFVCLTVRFQFFEPGSTSFLFLPSFLRYRMNAVYFSIPFLIQKADKQLFHRHLTNPVYIQLRQNTGDIIQQNFIAPDNIKIFRAEILFVIIKNIGNTVHRHCGLSGTRHTLDNQISPGGATDQQILFFLNGCNDLSKYVFFAFGKVFGQKFIIGYHIRVKVVFQPVIFNLIRPFPFQIDRMRPLGKNGIRTGTKTAFIINRSNRCTPIQY